MNKTNQEIVLCLSQIASLITQYSNPNFINSVNRLNFHLSQIPCGTTECDIKRAIIELEASKFSEIQYGIENDILFLFQSLKLDYSSFGYCDAFLEFVSSACVYRDRVKAAILSPRAITQIEGLIDGLDGKLVDWCGHSYRNPSYPISGEDILKMRTLPVDKDYSKSFWFASQSAMASISMAVIEGVCGKVALLSFSTEVRFADTLLGIPIIWNESDDEYCEKPEPWIRLILK